jgi:adenine-specific DNA-methyltransferase
MILEQKYSRSEFLNFLKNFIPNFEEDIRKVNSQGLKVSKDVYYLGESADLDLSVFELTHTSSSNARISLATDGLRIMKESATYSALIIYQADDNNDWRLSLMTATPEKNKKGKAGMVFSNPRRFSFFLGPNSKTKTPSKFLINQGAVKDFEDLQMRFSMEVVNKEFYKQISKSFAKLVGGTFGTGRAQKTYAPVLKLPSVSEGSKVGLEFAVRLIGRIIFCWFLREKKSQSGISLMPKKLLSLNAIKNHSDYYHQVLEPIFFEVLNKPEKSRKDIYLEEPFSLIPYLNGGLFTPHDEDFFSYHEELQAINHNTLIIPDEWFVEFYEILETYNFTIDENTSFDEELSIDPEMLGRIFENLLAEINPETGETARKSTGSYYTPRSIVNYMVDESLVFYLVQKTKIEENALRALVSYDLSDDEDFPLSGNDKRIIINALETLKLLDPACGSGAFPIGALQKIVFILQQIDPDGNLWFEKQLEKMSPEFKRVIEREFAHQNFDYIRKLGIIRQNIYGVDIQPIATEIARLRCFLTLVVEQYVNDKEENRNIQPLPNLEFKFVTANTLIGLPQQESSPIKSEQTEMFDDREKIDDLRLIREQYFTASGIGREQLKTEFVTAQKILVGQLIKEHGYIGISKAELTQKLTDWEPFSHKASDWFDSDWMFGIKKGFDIVIGNPPYIQIKQISWDDRKIYQNNYLFATGRFNIFYLFIELAAKLIGSSGLTSFIVPDRLLLNTQLSDLRAWLLNDLSLIEIVSFDETVFESAVVDSIILLFSKGQLDETVRVKNKATVEGIINQESMIIPKTFFKITQNTQFNLNYNPLASDIITKINAMSVLLKTIAETKDGIIQGKVADKLFLKAPIDGKSKKLLFGKDIGRYKITFNDNWVNYNPDEMMKLEVNRRGEGIRPGLWMRNPKIFERAKILTRQTADEIIAVFDTDQHYYSNTLHGTTIINENYSPWYVLGILNSNLMTWYYRYTTAEEGKVFAQIKIKLLELLPIPKIEKQEQTLIINLTKEIADSIARNQEKMYKLIDELDQVVYLTFDLTKEEIAIVEESVGR